MSVPDSPGGSGIAIALAAKNLSKRFGGVRAVSDLDLQLAQGQVLGLIGPNGSGKSTTMQLISGYLRPDAGSVRLNGQRIDRLPVYRRAGMGLGQTFQSPAVFLQLTVMENVLTGCHAVNRTGTRLADVFLRPLASGRAGAMLLDRCARALAVVGLDDREHELAAVLTYGGQKLLALARAIVADPQVLLMDEPLAGLDSGEMERLVKIIRDLRSRGCSILFAEHNVPAVMALCDRISVLNFGVKIAEGTPAEIQRHPDVLDAYLGREETNAGG